MNARHWPRGSRGRIQILAVTFETLQQVTIEADRDLIALFLRFFGD